MKFTLDPAPDATVDTDRQGPHKVGDVLRHGGARVRASDPVLLLVNPTVQQRVLHHIFEGAVDDLSVVEA